MVTGNCASNDNAKTGDATSVATANESGREMGVDIGRVGAWATDFEKLLLDPVGLRTFTVCNKCIQKVLINIKIQLANYSLHLIQLFLLTIGIPQKRI